ncbi:Lipase-3 domain-containing protein [Mycena venus]|uniref:Lipase-3 domain-containing protein n=1 Tax=Mycena venus TaxID=2733690 RepID=A0A8H6X7F6_9AGAR|nr:Lipase-3 domain-containing protein [Mycena venus]
MLEAFDELTHYFKYASSAYSPVCMRPNGNTLVLQFGNHISDIQGFIARDDDRKEVVVALRGSASITDALLDANILLVPFLTPGVKLPRTPVPSFLFFSSAEQDIFSKSTRARRFPRSVHGTLSPSKLPLRLPPSGGSTPGHRLVTVGHSMGGALATLAAVSLLQLFPASPVMDQTRTYSYGAPRTGASLNEVFAAYVNAEFGARAFRVVHTNDGVPTIIPTSLGYHHHGIEYWQHADPPSPSTTLRCAAGGEDPCCSASIPSGGVTPAHATVGPLSY